MRDYQSLALSYAEELSDLKRKHANLERHCRGLESKLSKTRDRMKMYRARCKAWESAFAKVYEIYWGFMRDEEPMAPHKAYATAVCAANIRKEVAPTYPSPDCVELKPKILNRSPSTQVDESE